MACIFGTLVWLALAIPLALARRIDRQTVRLVADEKPKLCDASIVKETCFILNGEDNHGDADVWVSSVLLRETLSATPEAISSLWTDLGLPVEKPAEKGGFWIECSTLCSKTISYIPRFGTLPPSSDMMCYTIGQETYCDLDVSPDMLRGLGPGPDEDLPDFQDKPFLQKQAASALAQMQMNDSADTPLALIEMSRTEDVEYGQWEIVERIANLFRIYPAEKPPPAMKSRVQTPTSRAAHQSWSSTQERNHIRAARMSVAYMSKTIRAFHSRNTRTHMQKWFGSVAFNSPSTRKEIIRVLNSVDHMISNVEYVYPGPECEANTYAYVYPKAYRCRRSKSLMTSACTKYYSKFVFYLCPYYFKRPREMVETLVHEGSHHATSYTDDVDYNGYTAYGRSTCMKLARADPRKALKNADNFCYYIQDVGAR